MHTIAADTAPILVLILEAAIWKDLKLSESDWEITEHQTERTGTVGRVSHGSLVDNLVTY